MKNSLEDRIASAEVYWIYGREAGCFARLPLLYTNIRETNSLTRPSLITLVHEICGGHFSTIYVTNSPIWIWVMNQLSNLRYFRVIKSSEETRISEILRDYQKTRLENILGIYYKVLQGPLEAIGVLGTIATINQLIASWSLMGFTGVLFFEYFKENSSLAQILAESQLFLKEAKEFRNEFIQAALNDEKAGAFVASLFELGFDKLLIDPFLPLLDPTNYKPSPINFIKKDVKELGQLFCKYDLIRILTFNTPLTFHPENLEKEDYNPTLRLEKILEYLQANEIEFRNLNSDEVFKKAEEIRKKFKWSDGRYYVFHLYRSRTEPVNRSRPLLVEQKERIRLLNKQSKFLFRKFKEFEKSKSLESSLLASYLLMSKFMTECFAFSPVFVLNFNTKGFYLKIRRDITRNLKKESFWMLNFLLTCLKLNSGESCPLASLYNQPVPHNNDIKEFIHRFSYDRDQFSRFYIPYSFTQSFQRCQKLCSKTFCEASADQCKVFRKILSIFYAKAYGDSEKF